MWSRRRTPPGFSQSLAHHPDVRRHVAAMSVDLEAARLLTYQSAWLSDTEGPTPAALAAMYRAKYFVGEAVTRITRTAMTLGGAHALFKTSPLERLFRDGAVAPVHEDADFEQRLRPRIRQRTHALAAARGQDHGAHSAPRANGFERRQHLPVDERAQELQGQRCLARPRDAFDQVQAAAAKAAAQDVVEPGNASRGDLGL